MPPAHARPDPDVPPRPSREEALRLGRARTLARRRRIRRIRRSAVGLTLALFVAAWVTIFVQLAAGHDPALATAARRATKSPVIAAPSDSSVGATGSAAAAQGSTTSAEKSTPSDTSSSSQPAAMASQSSSSDQGASSAQSSMPSPAPVTTSQS